MPVPNKFVEFIRERRKALGLSQTNLAGKAGISPSAIKRIEAGEVLPQTKTLEALALVLQVPLHSLIDLLDPREASPTEDPTLKLVGQLSEGNKLLLKDFLSLLIKHQKGITP